MKTDLEYAKEFGIKQFLQRAQQAQKVGQIDNGSLVAESPMYFYCKYCGILIEELPEDYLFSPRSQCSQCEGLDKEGWLEEACSRQNVKKRVS